MPPKKLQTVTKSKGYECAFCYSTENDEEAYGKMLRKSGITIHYFCMLFSSGLWQRGKRDCDGILGFLPTDIRREQKRGVDMICHYCDMKGGTIICSVKTCGLNFHFKCNRDAGGLCQFYEQFRSFCPEHRPRQKIPSGFPKTTDSSNSTCSICMLDVEGQVSNDTLCAPCCGGSWFHKICIQRYAVSAGSYFFKCPLCNNKELFEAEMLKFGIYIPEQDAAWEREPNAFQELLERYNNCDADTCLCPHGRSHRGQEGSQWDLLLCSWCGSSGTHQECHGFTNVGKDNLCRECLDINSVIKQVKVKQKPKKASTKFPRVAANVEEIRQQLEKQRTCLLKARRAARKQQVTAPNMSDEAPSTSQQPEEGSQSGDVEEEAVFPVTSARVLEDSRLINSTPVVHIERTSNEVEVNILDSDDELEVKATDSAGIREVWMRTFNQVARSEFCQAAGSRTRCRCALFHVGHTKRLKGQHCAECHICHAEAAAT